MYQLEALAASEFKNSKCIFKYPQRNTLYRNLASSKSSRPQCSTWIQKKAVHNNLEGKNWFLWCEDIYTYTYIPVRSYTLVPARVTVHADTHARANIHHPYNHSFRLTNHSCSSHLVTESPSRKGVLYDFHSNTDKNPDNDY